MTSEGDADLKRLYVELHNLIQKIIVIEEESDGLRPGLLMEWTVLTATQKYDDDGEMSTAVAYIAPWGRTVPYHRLLGLVEYVRALINKSITETDD